MYYNYCIAITAHNKVIGYKVGQTKNFKNRFRALQKENQPYELREIVTYCVKDENLSLMMESSFRRYFDKADFVERAFRKKDYFYVIGAIHNLDSKVWQKLEKRVIKDLAKIYGDTKQFYEWI